MAVINVTGGSTGDVGSTAATLINALQADLLEVVKFNTVLEQLFDSVPLTNAKTMQWNRLERRSVATTPSQLTEGVNPNAVGLQINSITATIEEYGERYFIAELAELSAKNGIVQETMKTAAYAMAETRARLLYTVADAATSVQRVNGRANDNAIAIGDTWSFHEIAEVVSILAGNGVPRYPGDAYRMVLPSHLYYSISVDPNWGSARQFSRSADIDRGYVGQLHGADIIKVVDNSFTLTISGTTGNSDSIYSGFVAGPGFAKVTDMGGRQLFLDAPGSGDDTLRLYYKVGWKMRMKGVITNQGFGRRLRASGNNAGSAA